MKNPTLQLLVMFVAAALEVGGDALIRSGLRSRGWLVVVIGFAVLGSYGIAINQLPIDFSKLLGSYVGFFALISVACGWIVFDEMITPTTWLGLGVIVIGSLVMQFGAA